MGNTINKKSPLYEYAKNNGFLLNENTNIGEFVEQLTTLGLVKTEDFGVPIEVKLSEGKRGIILPFNQDIQIDYARLGIWRLINHQYFVSDC